MTFFQNKTVWITGASSGIGEALVYELAKQQANIIISARRQEELERVKKNANYNNISILTLDLVEFDAFETKTKEAISFYGQVDVLIHNGGISQRSWVKETTLEVHRKLMEVDYFSYVALTKAVLPHFQERKIGQFAVISSVMGKIGTPMRSAYAAAKHALHGFFDCLRAEVWKENIKVTIICPGYIRTNVSLNALTATGEKNNQLGEDIGAGFPADKCAQQILKAIKNGKNEVYVGKPFGKEWLAMQMQRFFPNILANLVKKQVPK